MHRNVIRAKKREATLPTIDSRRGLNVWLGNYNEVHPHSGLKFLSPREFLRLSA